MQERRATKTQKKHNRMGRIFRISRIKKDKEFHIPRLIFYREEREGSEEKAKSLFIKQSSRFLRFLRDLRKHLEYSLNLPSWEVLGVLIAHSALSCASA